MGAAASTNKQPSPPANENMEEEAEAGGDRCCWSWLPEDVLLTVMGFMEVPDVVRSGAACSAWRAAAAAFRRHRLPTPRQPPCLLYACDAYGPGAAALYSPSTAATFRVPIRIPRAVAGAAHGWLFATDDEANPYLVNPVTGARATLPPITTLARVRSRETLVGGVVYGVDVAPARDAAVAPDGDRRSAGRLQRQVARGARRRHDGRRGRGDPHTAAAARHGGVDGDGDQRGGARRLRRRGALPREELRGVPPDRGLPHAEAELRVPDRRRRRRRGPVAGGEAGLRRLGLRKREAAEAW